MSSASPLQRIVASALASVAAHPHGIELADEVVFNKDVRGFLQVAPNYVKPVRYDAHKLQGLLGSPQIASYDVAIGQTLAWITARLSPPTPLIE